MDIIITIDETSSFQDALYSDRKTEAPAKSEHELAVEMGLAANCDRVSRRNDACRSGCSEARIASRRMGARR
jgi:hypothetical protein